MPFLKTPKSEGFDPDEFDDSWLSQGFYGLLLSEWPLHMVYSKTIDRWETKGEQMKVLVVVDMQNDFIDGALGTPEAQAIVPRVVEKIKTTGDIVYVTKDTHYADYLDTQEGKLLPVPHCIAETYGWNIEKNVQNALDEREEVYTYEKETFGSVDLGAALDLVWDDNLDEIILVGLCTDICVISNALLIKAYLSDVKITVDASCCAGTTPERHKNALAAMKMCQINIENEEESV